MKILYIILLSHPFLESLHYGIISCCMPFIAARPIVIMYRLLWHRDLKHVLMTLARLSLDY
jgi:hypothetical protein